jgi:hypothetical protein
MLISTVSDGQLSYVTSKPAMLISTVLGATTFSKLLSLT